MFCIIGALLNQSSIMKNVFYFVALLFILSCSRKDGAVGPKGDKGDTGAIGQTGAKGETGKAGTGADQPKIYDTVVDLSTFATYDFPTAINPYDVVMAYISNNEGFYTAMPFNSFAYTQGKTGFFKLATWFTYCEFFVSFRNDTTIPTGSKFLIRVVVLKGMKGAKIDAERYAKYENLKADFNLPD